MTNVDEEEYGYVWTLAQEYDEGDEVADCADRDGTGVEVHQVDCDKQVDAVKEIEQMSNVTAKGSKMEDDDSQVGDAKQGDTGMVARVAGDDNDVPGANPSGNAQQSDVMQKVWQIDEAKQGVSTKDARQAAESSHDDDDYAGKFEEEKPGLKLA